MLQEVKGLKSSAQISTVKDCTIPDGPMLIKQMIALLALSGSTCLLLILFINWSITRLLRVTRLYRCWQQLYLKVPQLNWNSWSINPNWLHFTSASFTYVLFISNYKDILYGIGFWIWHKKITMILKRSSEINTCKIYPPPPLSFSPHASFPWWL